ncbi:MAG: hypothetical protein ACPKPY_03510 [Nitrososphaeraceae archaeon]
MTINIRPRESYTPIRNRLVISFSSLIIEEIREFYLECLPTLIRAEILNLIEETTLNLITLLQPNIED